MGDYSEFSIPVRLMLAAYRWRRIDPVPWTTPRRSLSLSNVAIVSTAGMVPPGQAPFDSSVRGGDWSLRTIEDDTNVLDLIETHRSESFDHEPLRSDPNIAFPLDRLHELVRDGIVGRSNRRHLSFMGSITAPGRLQQESAREASEILRQDGVDVALLVPV